MVVGAAFGGEFTRRTAHAGRLAQPAAGQRRAGRRWPTSLSCCWHGSAALALKRARASEGEETDFSVRDIAHDIGRSRHLQIIIAIMAVTFIVDVLVELPVPGHGQGALQRRAVDRLSRQLLRPVAEPFRIRGAVSGHRRRGEPLRRGRHAPDHAHGDHAGLLRHRGRARGSLRRGGAAHRGLLALHAQQNRPGTALHAAADRICATASRPSSISSSTACRAAWAACC